jgi:hypothetical protein
VLPAQSFDGGELIRGLFALDLRQQCVALASIALQTRVPRASLRIQGRQALGGLAAEVALARREDLFLAPAVARQLSGQPDFSLNYFAKRVIQGATPDALEHFLTGMQKAGVRLPDLAGS